MTGLHFSETDLRGTIWPELEFGSHTADLELWRELAEASNGVLELGAGAGRVTLDLARRGHFVVAVERDDALAFQLIQRKKAEDLRVMVVGGDIRELAAVWPDAVVVGAAIAPLHLIQQVVPEARAALLADLADLLPAGGRLGLVVVDESSFVSADLEPKPLPDMREVDGWVYSSEPLWVQVDEGTIRARRIRELVSPDGEIERSVHDDLLYRLSPDALEMEAGTAGFRPVERRSLRTEPSEADSIAVILERG